MIDDVQSKSPTLGARFWVTWLLAIAILVAAFLGALWFAQTRLDAAPGAVTEAAATIAFATGMIAIAMFPARENQRRGNAKPMRPATVRFLRRFLIAMIAYVIALFAVIAWWDYAQPTGLLAWAVALAPAAPLLFSVRADWLYLKEEDDEFLKARTREAYMWATGLTLAICTIWGFLETFGLTAHVPLWVALPIWGLCQIPAQAIVGWKYR
jgi:hypothetical protein